MLQKFIFTVNTAANKTMLGGKFRTGVYEKKNIDSANVLKLTSLDKTRNLVDSMKKKTIQPVIKSAALEHYQHSI